MTLSSNTSKDSSLTSSPRAPEVGVPPQLLSDRQFAMRVLYQRQLLTPAHVLVPPVEPLEVRRSVNASASFSGSLAGTVSSPPLGAMTPPAVAATASDALPRFSTVVATATERLTSPIQALSTDESASRPVALVHSIDADPAAQSLASDSDAAHALSAARRRVLRVALPPPSGARAAHFNSLSPLDGESTMGQGEGQSDSPSVHPPLPGTATASAHPPRQSAAHPQAGALTATMTTTTSRRRRPAAPWGVLHTPTGDANEDSAGGGGPNVTFPFLADGEQRPRPRNARHAPSQSGKSAAAAEAAAGTTGAADLTTAQRAARIGHASWLYSGSDDDDDGGGGGGGGLDAQPADSATGAAVGRLPKDSRLRVGNDAAATRDGPASPLSPATNEVDARFPASSAAAAAVSATSSGVVTSHSSGGGGGGGTFGGVLGGILNSANSDAFIGGALAAESLTALAAGNVPVGVVLNASALTAGYARVGSDGRVLIFAAAAATAGAPTTEHAVSGDAVSWFSARHGLSAAVAVDGGGGGGGASGSATRGTPPARARMRMSISASQIASVGEDGLGASFDGLDDAADHSGTAPRRTTSAMAGHNHLAHVGSTVVPGGLLTPPQPSVRGGAALLRSADFAVSSLQLSLQPEPPRVAEMPLPQTTSTWPATAHRARCYVVM